MGRFLFGVCGVAKGGRDFSFDGAVSSFAFSVSSFVPVVSAFAHPLVSNDENGGANDETSPLNDETTTYTNLCAIPLFTIRSTCIIENKSPFCL